MKDLAVETLTSQGHAVAMSDLYAMNWNQVTGLDDFVGERSVAARLSIAREETC